MSKALKYALLAIILLAAGPSVAKWPDSSTSLQAYVNVKSFGAVPDDLVDDLASIRAAITSLGTADCGEGNGGVVFLPRGVYYISDTLNIPRCVRLVGEGRASSFLRAAAGFAGTAVVTLCEEDTVAGEGCRVENLGIWGSQIALYGILDEHSQEFSGARDVHIGGILTYGIWMRANGGSTAANYDLERITVIFTNPVDTTDRGILIQSGRPHTLENITIAANTGGADADGVCIEAGGSGDNDWRMSSIQCELNGPGIYINGLNDITIDALKHIGDGSQYSVRLGAAGGGNGVYGLSSAGNSNLAVQDDLRSVNIVQANTTFYQQGGGGATDSSFLSSTYGGTSTWPVNRLVKPVFYGSAGFYAGATALDTCGAALLGAAYYDTNAGATGDSDDGRLCCCANDQAQGYIWRDCSTPTTELTGATTTDCGT